MAHGHGRQRRHSIGRKCGGDPACSDLLLSTYNHLDSEYFGSAAYGSFAIMIGSSIVLCGGAVFVGFSTASAAFLVGMVIYTFGEGILVATQAYIASAIDKSYLARVMAMFVDRGVWRCLGVVPSGLGYRTRYACRGVGRPTILRGC